MSKARDLQEMNLEELQALAGEKSEDLMQMRLRLNLRQLDNPLQVRNARREIARIRTVIRQKQREQSAVR